FHQVDGEVIAAVTSPEADWVTPLMSKIYLRLVSAPAECWEGPGTLYFTSKTTEGKQIKASKVLYEVLGVASATAHKALSWMHEQGIIGYSSGKNGVGIRIFLNRAATSIGLRDDRAGKKILPFARGSNGEGRGSLVEPAFKDSFAVQRVYSDTDLNPHAPKNGADTKPDDKKVLNPTPPFDTHAHTERAGREVKTPVHSTSTASVDEIVMRLKNELEPCLKSAATHAAAQTVAREVARTREWFETKVLPKAVRVAQHETYDLLRKLGTLDERRERARAGLQVGCAADSYTKPVAKPLTPEGITEIAETCVALLETQGKKIDVTLAEIGSEGGGWLLPEDALKVGEEAGRLLRARSEKR
ncbi:MAG: hypothetical protein M3371_13665, partial [Acidobacteriota bacterium]|nr:hypothetical protein [Acidobacteriota bacterium]